MAQSNEPTIEQMRYTIAKFMGYEKVHVGYAGTEEETEWQRNHEEWMIKAGIQLVGDYIVDVPNNKWHRWEDVKYHASWDWLMPVVEKIHNLAVAGDALNTITSGVIFTFSIFAPLKDVHLAVYQFIIWHNQQKQTESE